MAVAPLFVNETPDNGPVRQSRRLTRYRVHHVPTVVILGPDSVVRFTAYGYPGNSVVLRELRKIALGGKKPRTLKAG